MATSFRLYAYNESGWPRLSIGIYEHRKSYRFIIQRKEQEHKGHWGNTDVPKELMSDLREMLEEVHTYEKKTKL